ncbi:NAD(P)H oxidoreductase [Gallibacterium anatis]|uniref:NAD(P)H-dependent oxidoreductase n=1 Tax=Gallibacterium anatis TaxID=750 RepID=UPI000531C975|nr:NAD(P)H-dependent oxidoreductase [Gallibacterium anatis]KGQ45139.1 NAD(P)H oxidoreductase [Gallibacterium anatis]KGQ53692.1 NAD(P)H oxidoreductase [Gallibacterium anatis]KGQ66539.1 NAD(P)H oxidoreductase [Gallibacterium anatis]
MKHLIIYTHPNENSFNHAILEEVIQTSKEMGMDVVVRDLYQLKFNPILTWNEFEQINKGNIPVDIKLEQQFIDEADLIILIYPLWWMGFPAMLKGYLDRVFSHGFAYKTDDNGSEGLLNDKKMLQFVTFGNNIYEYQQKGFMQAFDHTLVNGLFNYCGITDIHSHFFGDIHIIDDKLRKQILTDVKQVLQKYK